ncbi:MAG: LysM peptidoglycan-binding domain-containing protein, partial [Chromatiaceae bacterium]|nr:LysM peptidoglycan-binding domain-containing protein [Chromatiaceae bacterium]
MQHRLLKTKPRMRRYIKWALTLIVCFVAGGLQAADSGSRHHAQGTFDAATGTYEVAKGDDLDAIAERFGVTLQELTKANKLSSTEIEVGQKLAIPGEPAGSAGSTEEQVTGEPALSGGGGAKVQVTGKLGSPSATTTLPGNQLPAPAPKFGGVIKDDALESTPWW